MQTGLSPGPALTDDVRDGDPRRTTSRTPALREHHPHRVRAQHPGHGAADPDRPESELGLVPPRPADDRGSGARTAVSQLNNYSPRLTRNGSGRQPESIPPPARSLSLIHI